MEKIDVILDIWNWYIKGIVVWIENDKKILLVKESVKSKWIRKWRVLDSDDLAQSIWKIIDSFEKKLGEWFIDEVVLGISHPNMIIKRIKEQKRILDKNITSEDVSHLYKVVNEFGWEPNYEIITFMPVTWIIDDHMKVSNPLDMEANKLELIADVFMIPRTLYNNLYEIFNNLWIEVKSIVPNILWASEVSLDLDSKDLWVCLIDIWTNQTSFVVYEEWMPLYYGVLPYWWEDVTKDISIGLQVDISEAERIKREYWILKPEEIDENSNLDLKFVSEIISARYEDIFEKINLQLIELERDWKLAWWIVFVWWWAKVKNIDIVAKKVFKLAVFFGKDKVMKFWEISNNLQFINVIWDYVWFHKYISESTKNFGLNLWYITKYFAKLVEKIKKYF